MIATMRYPRWTMQMLLGAPPGMHPIEHRTTAISPTMVPAAHAFLHRIQI